MTSFNGLVVIVPTRNRAQLAAAALQSVLEARCPDVRVLVSDNSTDQREIDRLAATCKGLGIDRVRPPEPMPMATHWEWALDQALAGPENHVTVLTDRMLFTPGGLTALLALLRQFPEEVVSYAHDRLDDLTSPMRLEQFPWTGRVLDIPTGLSAAVFARTMGIANMALPRLLNCVAPRKVIEDVRRRFDGVWKDAIAPDYAFAFRCAATIDAVLFYDRPILLHYALDRSNGASVSAGRVTADHADFLANLDPRGINFAAPIPGLDTVLNTIVHEYYWVRSRTPGWPRVDPRRYLSALDAEVASMDDGELKRDALRALRLKDQEERVALPAQNMPIIAKLALAVRAPRHAVHRLWFKAGRHSRFRSVVERVTGLAAPDVAARVTNWATRDSAIAYARTAPRPPQAGISTLEFGIELEFGRQRIRCAAVVRH